MNPRPSLQSSATGKEAREDVKLQLDQYLHQQPAPTQSLHSWMKRLEVGGVGIIVGAFVVALYLSFAWQTINPILIPIGWFVFAASIAPAMIFLGLDAITLRAFPPVVWPGRPPKFVTGSGAVRTGWALVVIAPVAAAFWGFFAYAVGTLNFAMIGPLVTILGVAMGVGIAVSIVFKLVRDISRSL